MEAAFNYSNATNGSFEYFQPHESFQTAVKLYIGIESLLFLAGAFINIWFIAAIVTSQDMRTQMRNKLLINMAVIHLVDCFIGLPMGVANVSRVLTNVDFNCRLSSIASAVLLIQDLMSNWVAVTLVAYFIANIRDHDLARVLTPQAMTIVICIVLALPWAAGLVIVVTVLYYFHEERYGNREMGCVFPTPDSWEILVILDSIVPLAVLITLVAVACYFRWRRFSGGLTSGVFKPELLGRGRQVDSALFYVILTALLVVTDVWEILDLLRVFIVKDPYSIIMFSFVCRFLSDMRVLLVPITWLLLPDIRQRMKTWRPWYRPAPGIDLTVRYGKEVE